MNAPVPVGAGAMLARLIGLGRRCGLQPEAVLLHVLDGAPLPDPESELLRNIAHEMAGMPEHERPDVAPETLIRKGDRAVHLYGTTALSNPAIGRLIESTAQTVSWFIRKARDRGDALVADGDRRRGRLDPQPACGESFVPPTEAVDPHRPTEAAADPLGLASDDEQPDGLVFRAPELDPTATSTEQERLDDLNDQLQVRLTEEPAREDPSPPAVSVASLSKSEAALELWAKTDLSYVDIAHEIGSTPASVYERIRQGKKRGDKRWVDGFARRNPSTGSQPDVANGGGEHEIAQQHEQDATLAATGEPAGETRQGDDPVAHSNSADTVNEAPMVVDGAGDDCSTELRSESSDIPPAGENGEARRSQTAPDVSPEGAQERPGSRVQIPPGTSVAFEGAPVAQSGRAGQNGDAGSNPVRASLGEPGSSEVKAPSVSPEGATDVVSVLEASPAPEPAGSPAPLPDPPPAEKGTVRRDSGSAVRPARPGSSSDGSVASPELPDDQAVAINAGWIVGPAGTVKGFPLVNAILQVLATGDLLGAGAIAQRAGARSPAAVLAMLDQWRGDLEGIGIEILRFGQDSIRLRRRGAR